MTTQPSGGGERLTCLPCTTRDRARDVSISSSSVAKQKARRAARLLRHRLRALCPVLCAPCCVPRAVWLGSRQVRGARETYTKSSEGFASTGRPRGTRCADAAGRLRNCLRRLAVVHDSMLECSNATRCFSTQAAIVTTACQKKVASNSWESRSSSWLQKLSLQAIKFITT